MAHLKKQKDLRCVLTRSQSSFEKRKPIPMKPGSCERLSWLNAAEIKINVMDTECTGRRVFNKKNLALEVTAWTKRRNDQKKINWRFTKNNADKKLSKYYVPIFMNISTSKAKTHIMAIFPYLLLNIINKEFFN